MALQASLSPSSSRSSSSFTYAWEYHVFLSFRGPDTRRHFIGHLYKALRDKGIHTFIDDKKLQRGEEITPSLDKAIEESRIAIPVFSKNYASSAFCLDELAKIMECVKGKGRWVLPVFYDVEPSEVRHQRGSYGEALAKHKERHDMKKVQRWREALRQAANLSGDHFKLGNENECDFIEKIVKEISKRISRVPLHVADYPVGLEDRVLQVNRLLNDGFDGGVDMVGIYGTGGIGKTTIARAVYNSIADQFDHLCFLENLSELSIKHGLPYLQNILLSKILGEKDCNLGSVSEGTQIIKERLRCKKILLVLDNIDKHEQLHALIGRPDWFGFGSKVIITTRDKHLLTNHMVEKVYEVEVLDEERAIELFTRMAFKSKKVEPCYMDILKELVTYASGLPLALEVIGSRLCGRHVEEWRSALDQYRKIPNGDLQEKLKVSFDALDFYEKNVFLDIACCFNGYELKEVVNILRAHYDVDLKYAISVLVDKSLIKIIDHHDVIILHDLIQYMGREIVRLESPGKPGARSRLWLAKDIIEVLQEDKGSDKIQIIHLEFGYNGDVIEWNGQAFTKMEDLKTLIIRKGQFSQGPIYLPNSLRVLIWERYPLDQYLPSCDFDPKLLAILHLPRTCLNSVQLAKLMKTKFENVKVLRFDECERITKIPNPSCAPKLEELSFKNCKNLIEIDESVGSSLGKLKRLDAEGCSQLRIFPPLMLPSLERLNLDGCSSLESFPEISGNMGSMRYLFVRDIPIIKFPYSIHNLTGLDYLSLFRCGTVLLPSSITMLPKLRTLTFDECNGLVLPNQDECEEKVSPMPSSSAISLLVYDCNISEQLLRTAVAMFPNVKDLSLPDRTFGILPKWIEELHVLKTLYLDRCEKLEEIRRIPPSIEELDLGKCTSLSPMTRKMLLNKELHEERQFKQFILPGERLPEWFEHRTRGPTITFWVRNKFPAVSFGFSTPTASPSEEFFFGPELTIYCKEKVRLTLALQIDMRGGDVCIVNEMQTTFEDEVDEALSENEWTRAMFSVCLSGDYDDDGMDTMEVGVHIIREKSSSMDDIQFTDPLSPKERDTLMELQVGQGTELLSLPPPMPLFNDNVNWDSNPEKMSSTTSQSSSIIKEPFKERIEDSFNGSEAQSSIGKRKASSSYAKTPAKVQKTATEQGVLTIFSKNHDKDSDVEVLETAIVPTSKANYGSYESSIQAENADQPVNSLIEIQPPSPQPLDPLAEVERLILGSYDLPPESTSATAASCSEIQTFIILRNLESLLNNPLEILIANGEIKEQIMDCLSKLVQLDDHIPISLQSIVAQVRNFYEDLIHNFPSIQQTLVDYSRLEETRSKLLENVKQAKDRKTEIDAKVSREKNQLEELAAEIADLKLKLKATEEKQNELQLEIKNGEAEKTKISEDASGWLMESKQVVEKIRSSEHAYRDAQNSKARFEGQLATLKGAFAANKP